MDLDFLPNSAPAPSKKSAASAYETDVLGALGEVAYSGDVETDAKAEESAILTGYRDRAKAEQSRRGWAEDGSFYSCLVFQTGDQLEAFIRAVGISVDRLDLIDGEALAEALKIELPSAPYRPKKMPEPSSSWDDFAIDL